MHLYGMHAYDVSEQPYLPRLPPVYILWQSIWHAFIISGFYQLYHLISEHSLCICIYIWYVWATIPLIGWLQYTLLQGSYIFLSSHTPQAASSVCYNRDHRLTPIYVMGLTEIRIPSPLSLNVRAVTMHLHVHMICPSSHIPRLTYDIFEQTSSFSWLRHIGMLSEQSLEQSLDSSHAYMICIWAAIHLFSWL